MTLSFWFKPKSDYKTKYEKAIKVIKLLSEKESNIIHPAVVVALKEFISVVDCD